MRDRSGWFGVLAFLVLALLIGGVAYAIGVNAGQAQVVQAVPAAPGTVVVPTYVHTWGWGFGFPFFPLFGILFFFLFIGLIFRAFRPRSWGGPRGWGGPGGGYGGYGPGPGRGPWNGDDVPPAFQPMLESWHRRAHGSPSDTTAPSGPTGPSGSTGPTSTGGSGPTGA